MTGGKVASGIHFCPQGTGTDPVSILTNSAKDQSWGRTDQTAAWRRRCFCTAYIDNGVEESAAV